MTLGARGTAERVGCEKSDANLGDLANASSLVFLVQPQTAPPPSPNLPRPFGKVTLHGNVWLSLMLPPFTATSVPRSKMPEPHMSVGHAKNWRRALAP